MANESKVKEWFESLKQSIENGKIIEAEEIITTIIQSQLLYEVKIENLAGEEMNGFREEAIKRNERNKKIEEIDDLENEALMALLELGMDESDAMKLVSGVKSVKEAKERYKQSLMS